MPRPHPDKSLFGPVSVRLYGCLVNQDCKSLEDAAQFTQAQLDEIIQMGAVTKRELLETLAANGLSPSKRPVRSVKTYGGF